MNGLVLLFQEPKGFPAPAPALPQKALLPFPPNPKPLDIGVALNAAVDGVVGNGDAAIAFGTGNIELLLTGNPPKLVALLTPGQAPKAVVDDARLGLVGEKGEVGSSFLLALF